MNSLVIVALPRENDPVNKYSSEKAAHMTLLYLGEQPADFDLMHVYEYLEHVTSMIQPFGMDVASRGVLGADEADVLFFRKNGYGSEEPKKLINYLLQDNYIKTLYDSQEQYPEWTPHLTMGYPTEPAKTIDGEKGDFYWVQFNRIALWVDDSVGPIFPLEYDYDRRGGDMAMSEEVLNVLSHHGVKGMKWGTRHDVGHEGEQVKTKKLAKLDKQYDKSFNGLKGYAKVNNAVAGHVNEKLGALNSKPEYNVPNLAANPKLHNKYMKEYEGIVEQSLNEAMRDLGTNASGTRRLKLTRVGSGVDTWWSAGPEELKVKHADGDSTYKITPRFDKSGKITGQKIEALDVSVEHGDSLDSFLEHHGVKGQKWGVRKSDAGPVNTSMETVHVTGVNKAPSSLNKRGRYLKKNQDTAVTVAHRPNTRLTTKGGANRPAHEDAINTAVSRRVAKTSTTDALSTKELRDLVGRMNLEQQYRQLTAEPENRFIAMGKAMLGDLIRQEARGFAQRQLSDKMIEKGLKPGTDEQEWAKARNKARRATPEPGAPRRAKTD